MKKQTKKQRGKYASQSYPSWVNDPDLIVFAGEKELPVGGIEQHSLTDWAGSLFRRTKVEVKADWEKVLGQMRYLLDQVSAVTKDYELEEVTFELGFSAEGVIVFVAKAGVTTTISAKFKRK